MMLSTHLRQALPSLPHSRVSKTRTALPHSFPRVMHLSMQRAKRAHARSVYQVRRVDTQRVLYHIQRTPFGLKLLDAHCKRTLLLARLDARERTIAIARAHARDAVVLSTRQHGQLFAITDVFCGAARRQDPPRAQLCAGEEFCVTRVSDGQVLVRVDGAKSLFVLPGLELPLYIMLIASVRQLSHF